MQRLIVAFGAFALTLSVSLGAHAGTTIFLHFRSGVGAPDAGIALGCSTNIGILAGSRVELETIHSGFRIPFTTMAPLRRHLDAHTDPVVSPPAGTPSYGMTAGVQKSHVMATCGDSTKAPVAARTELAQQTGRWHSAVRGGTSAPYFFGFSATQVFSTWKEAT